MCKTEIILLTGLNWQYNIILMSTCSFLLKLSASEASMIASFVESLYSFPHYNKSAADDYDNIFQQMWKIPVIEIIIIELS